MSIEPTNPWKKIDSNNTLTLWEAQLPKGGVMRIATKTQPEAWWLDHHYKRFGEHPPEVELGETGHRIRMPDEHEWREYGFKPRTKH